MIPTEATCSICDKDTANQQLYGYALCQKCIVKLGLFTDTKIQAHIRSFDESEDSLSYREKTEQQLSRLQKHYIKAEIKLLHILDRVGKLGG